MNLFSLFVVFILGFIPTLLFFLLDIEDKKILNYPALIITCVMLFGWAMFMDFAKKLNLDTNKFLSDFNSTKYNSLIQQDINLGRQVGVTGTPSLFMNGKRMQRRSFDDFKAAIESNLK